MENEVPFQSGGSDLLVFWLEGHLPAQKATFVGALGLGTQAVVLTVVGVSWYLTTAIRGTASVAAEAHRFVHPCGSLSGSMKTLNYPLMAQMTC